MHNSPTVPTEVDFRATAPDIGQLQHNNKNVADKFKGPFDPTPNVYDLASGTVVSWRLASGSTVGRVPVGHFEFPTEMTETLTVLAGSLTMGFGNGAQVLNKGDQIIVPPKSTLTIDAKSPAIYLCEYS